MKGYILVHDSKQELEIVGLYETETEGVEGFARWRRRNDTDPAVEQAMLLLFKGEDVDVKRVWHRVADTQGWREVPKDE